jgi:hypothetical protein
MTTQFSIPLLSEPEAGGQPVKTGGLGSIWGRRATRLRGRPPRLGPTTKPCFIALLHRLRAA